MNKKRVDGWILQAKEALETVEKKNERNGEEETIHIVQNGKMEKNYRSHISSFGSAVAGGSLKSAVSIFSEQGNADVPRQLLLKAIYYVISGGLQKDPKAIFNEVCNECTDAKREYILKEKYMDASLALKRAMNMFELIEKKQGER